MEHKIYNEPGLCESIISLKLQKNNSKINRPLQIGVNTSLYPHYLLGSCSVYPKFFNKILPVNKFGLIRSLLRSKFSVKHIESGETIIICNQLQHSAAFYIDIPDEPYDCIVYSQLSQHLTLNSLELIKKDINFHKIHLERLLIDLKDWPMCIPSSTIRFLFSSDLYKYFFNLELAKSSIISGMCAKDNIDSIMCILKDLKLQRIKKAQQILKLIAISTHKSICKMGVRQVNPKITGDKYFFLFGISHQSQDYSGESVPITIEVTIISIVIKVIFSKDKKPISFLLKSHSKDYQSSLVEPYLQHALEFLKDVNKHLPYSAFLYEKHTNLIVLKVSTKVLFPLDENTKMVSNLLNETIHKYLCYSHGLNFIYANMIQDIKELDKDSLINKKFSKESINEQVKFCRKLEKNLKTKLKICSNSLNQNQIIETALIYRERILIQGLKKSHFISQVFSSKAIFTHGRIIRYPSFLCKHTIQPICESLLEKNPLIYRKILRLNKEIEHFNYFIKLKSIYNNFGIYYGKIYYLFKTPMVSIVRAYTAKRYSKLLSQIETSLNKNLPQRF